MGWGRCGCTEKGGVGEEAKLAGLDDPGRVPKGLGALVDLPLLSPGAAPRAIELGALDVVCPRADLAFAISDPRYLRTMSSYPTDYDLAQL